MAAANFVSVLEKMTGFNDEGGFCRVGSSTEDSGAVKVGPGGTEGFFGPEFARCDGPSNLDLYSKMAQVGGALVGRESDGFSGDGSDLIKDQSWNFSERDLVKETQFNSYEIHSSIGATNDLDSMSGAIQLQREGCEKERFRKELGKGNKLHNTQGWSEFIEPMANADELGELEKLKKKKKKIRGKWRSDARGDPAPPKDSTEEGDGDRCWAFGKKLGISSREGDDKVAQHLGGVNTKA